MINEIVLTDASEFRATLSFRGPTPAEEAHSIARVDGPYCEFARTLPTGASVSSEGLATIVDPCYWTPELPFTYRALDGVGEVVLEFGLRRWETRRGDLMLDRRRTVLRGMHIDEDAINSDDWLPLRVQHLALVATDPSIEFCHIASKQGIPLVVMLEAVPASGTTDEYLNSLALCSAVFVVLLGRDWQARAAQSLPSGPLYGLAVCDEVVPPPDWARVSAVVLEERGLTDLLDVPPEFPLLVFRPGDSDFADAESARRSCEVLQGECSPLTGLAGYFCILPKRSHATL